MLITMAICLCLAMSVVATPIRDYEMKYATITPDIGDGCGHLYIQVLCFNNFYSKEVVIQRLTPKDGVTPPVITNGKVMKEAFDSYTPIGGNKTVQLNGAGNHDEGLAPGIYGLTLIDGNNCCIARGKKAP